MRPPAQVFLFAWRSPFAAQLLTAPMNMFLPKSFKAQDEHLFTIAALTITDTAVSAYFTPKERRKCPKT